LLWLCRLCFLGFCLGRRGRHWLGIHDADRLRVFARSTRVRIVDTNSRLTLLALDRDDAPFDFALVDIVRDREGLAASRARNGKRHLNI
jgi:hypothetical protein